MALGTVILLFALCAGVIVASGTRLSYYGDVIAERSGLGQAWVGVVAMASVTSLPELVTGVSAAWIGAPDIAVGDVVGSCLFNLLILGLLDLATPVPILNRLRPVHVLSAALGALLLCVLAVAILTAPRWPSWAGVGLATPVLGLGYAAAVRAVFRYERRHDQLADDAPLPAKYAHLTLRRALVGYAVAGAVLVGAAANLPRLGVALAEATGLEQSFVGTSLIAVSTSLPELVVSLAAVRLGAWDLAAANVLGSNLFNVAILAVDDVAFRQGPLLAVASPAHAVTAVGAAAMSLLVLAGLVVRPSPLRGRLTLPLVGLVLAYGALTALAY